MSTEQPTQAPPAASIIEISSRVPAWALGLKDLWAARELLIFLVWREVKGRYRQMALGPLWVIIQPLVAMVVFSIIFGRLAKIPSDGMPYPLFAYSALVPWQLFSGAANKASVSLVTNLSVIAKVYFPRLVVPLSACLSTLVDFSMSMVVLLGMLLAYGYPLTLNLLVLPLYVLLATLAALAVGLWMACLAVKFRDVGLLVSYFLQVWMYASPVVYPSSLVPEKWQMLYHLNPMAVVIEGFRWCLLGRGAGPDVMLLVAYGVVIVLLIPGALYFRRTERSIVDLL